MSIATGRTRSPSYPSLGLEEAIRKAELVYNAIDHKWVVADVIAENWEQSVNSGGFMVALAALKQFGLLEDEGRGPTRKFRLSDCAMEIILHKDDEEGEGADRRKRALKNAALLPNIHAELWTKFHGVLPSLDNAIRVYLLKGRKEEGKGELFNKDAVDSLIRQFRSTVAFAELNSSDIIPTSDERGKTEEREPVMDTPSLKTNSAIPQWPIEHSDNNGGPFIFFPLSGGNAVEIRLRMKLSQTDFETVKKLIDLSQASLVDSEKQ